MTSNPAKMFWISLVGLLVLHSVVSFASYRLFTVSTPEPGDGTPVDITTQAQKEAGEKVFRIVTGRTATPMPVFCYIYGGYAALGIAVLSMVCTRLRAP